MPAEVGRARAAVDERQAVEQGRRAERADDQVLEPRFERFPALEGRAAEHVEGHREQLDRDEERDQVLRLGQQDHAEDRGEQERLELAVARLLSAGARRPALATTAAPRPRRRGSRSGRRPVRARRAAGRPPPGPRARPTARCTGRRRWRA